MDLSLIAALTGQHPVFDKLLGDRTAALNVGGSKVADKGPHDTLDIYPSVGIKTRVLRCNKGIFQIVWNFINAGPHAILDAGIHRDELPFAIVDIAG